MDDMGGPRWWKFMGDRVVKQVNDRDGEDLRAMFETFNFEPVFHNLGFIEMNLKDGILGQVVNKGTTGLLLTQMLS